MANNYSKILELANKNNMGLSNTIKRDYGIPLDYSSVQASYDDAVVYAATDTLAYIGQPIAVGGTLYIVTDEALGKHSVTKNDVTTEYDVYIKEVGARPEGENKSIVVGADGKVSMYGFTAAPSSTLPRKKSDGTIEWVAIDAIVQGDGNEKTRVVAAADSDITVTEVYNSENDTYIYTLDVDFPAIPEYSVSKEDGDGFVTYRLTEDGAAVGEAVIVPDAYDDTVLTGRVSDAEAAIVAQGGRLNAVEDRLDVFFGSATEEEQQKVYDTLAEIQEYIANDESGASGMAASIKANTDAIAAINDESTGIYARAVADAATTAQNKVNDLASAVNQNTSDVSSIKSQITGINGNINTLSGSIGDLTTRTSTLEGGLQAETGARETLADTVNQHITDITNLKAKDETLASEIAANTEKFKNYSTTSDVASLIATEIGKIDHKALEEGIAANETAITEEATRAKAEEVKLAANIKTNTDAISENTGEIARIDGVLKAAIENEDDTVLNSIKELAAWVSEHETEVLPVVEANTQAIAKLVGEGAGSVKKTVVDAVTEVKAYADTAEANALAAAESHTNTEVKKVADDLATAKTNIATNTSDIAENVTAIANEKSARETAVSNLDTAYKAADKAITDKIGTLPSDYSTLVAGIATAKKAGTDAASAVSTLETSKVNKNTQDIATNAGETAKNAKAISDEVTRATGVEADFEERISAMETFWDTAEDSDSVVNKLKEIQEYIANDETGASGMAAGIRANTDAIAALNGAGSGSIQGKIAAAIEEQAAEDAATYATQDELAAVSAKANAAAVSYSEEQNLTDEQKEIARNNIDATGIYVGSGDMPEGYDIQIDTDGDVYSITNRITDDTNTEIPSCEAVKYYIANNITIADDGNGNITLNTSSKKVEFTDDGNGNIKMEII